MSEIEIVNVRMADDNSGELSTTLLCNGRGK